MAKIHTRRFDHPVLQLCIELMDMSLYDYYKEVHKIIDGFRKNYLTACTLNAPIDCKKQGFFTGYQTDEYFNWETKRSYTR